MKLNVCVGDRRGKGNTVM